jgi:GMP synthase (glutamine-hydrolysing)
MRLLTIVHQDDTGPGVFLEAISDNGAEQRLWKPAEDGAPPGDAADYDAILTCGGSAHPVQDAEYPWIAVERRFLARALEQRVPMFGVCLGSQLIAQAAGSRARRALRPEIGWYEVRLTAQAASDPVFGPLPSRFDALQWHSYEVPLADHATALASSDVCLQGYRIEDRVWGIQFHAEVTAQDFQRWLELDADGPDAKEISLDAAALDAQVHERIGTWNELGRGLCARFLKVASAL